MDKHPTEFRAYKMAREAAKNKVYTPPVLKEVENRIKGTEKCKHCKNTFSPNSSIISFTTWEMKYCSRECWEHSVEYQLNKQAFLAFYDTLNEVQKYYFRYDFVNNLFCQDYELEVIDWLDKESR
jgi:hypothetical protein